METNELELLKKVLPPYLMLDENTSRIYDADTEEQFFIAPGMKCSDVITAMLERARETGKVEGRIAFQYEARKLLGIEPVLTETVYAWAAQEKRLVRLENRK